MNDPAQQARIKHVLHQYAGEGMATPQSIDFDDKAEQLMLRRLQNRISK